jgi:Tfp pilus assembly protein PilF
MIQAAAGYERAFRRVPYNADYAFRAGRALLYASRDARPALSRAIAADPTRAGYWVTRAKAEDASPTPDFARVRADYEQALRIDPNNVDVRLDFAAVLARQGDANAARVQYESALAYNDKLHPDEPKRLKPARLGEIRRALAALPR